MKFHDNRPKSFKFSRKPDFASGFYKPMIIKITIKTKFQAE